MAPLAPNLTKRLFVDYTSGGVTHTLLLRFVDGTTDSAAIFTAQGLAGDLSPFMNANDSFFRARVSEAGTDFSLPVPWVTVVGTGVGAGFVEDADSAFVSVCGRTGGGRRWRADFFTIAKITTDWPADNRYSPGESTNADDIVQAFRTAADVASPTILGIDGLPLIVYDYLNIAKSAYWQRQQRNA